jgi:WD40 repeat protein
MTKQLNLLPSGCQLSDLNSTLYYDEEKIIYASSLAVYILDPKTFLVEKILSSAQRALMALAVSPTDKDLLIAGSLDGTVTAWSIEEESIINRINLNVPIIAAWDYFTNESCYVLTLNPVSLQIWYVFLFHLIIDDNYSFFSFL